MLVVNNSLNDNVKRYTTKSKQTVIFNRDTGACVFSAIGADGMPEIDREDLGTCEDYNIPLDILQSITDNRFDK